MRTFRISRLGLLAGLVAVASCGEAGPGLQDDPNPTPQNPDRPYTYRLEIVGYQNVTVAPTAQVALQVRYTKDAAPIANATVGFRVVGDSKDTRLLRAANQTNVAGVTETVVQAGQLTGQLRIEAGAPNAAPVEWAVNVQAQTPVAPPAQRLAGVLTLTSHFNVETSFDGTKVGEALNVLNQISDDPDDPGKFVVDRVLENLNNDAIKAVANFLRPALNTEVNKLLTSISPSFVSGMKKLARDISTVARRFEVTSLFVSAQPQESNKPMKVDHQLTHLAWEIDGRRAQYSFSQLGMDSPRANGVDVIPAHVGPGHEVGEHAFALKYGAFLVVAINELVIPNIDQNARNLGELFGSLVQCPAVGRTMNNTVGLGGEALWAAACSSAVKLLAGYVEGRILAIDDDASRLSLKGQAVFLDNNQDAHFDVVNGSWNGSFSLGPATAPLDPTRNTYSGLRTQ